MSKKAQTQTNEPDFMDEIDVSKVNEDELYTTILNAVINSHISKSSLSSLMNEDSARHEAQRIVKIAKKLTTHIIYEHLQ